MPKKRVLPGVLFRVKNTPPPKTKIFGSDLKTPIDFTAKKGPGNIVELIISFKIDNAILIDDADGIEMEEAELAKYGYFPFKTKHLTIDKTEDYSFEQDKKDAATFNIQFEVGDGKIGGAGL